MIHYEEFKMVPSIRTLNTKREGVAPLKQAAPAMAENWDNR